MIRIRYSSELQPGLHGRAERHGAVTFVYLLPGLTSWQRRAALRRMRQQGRMGICPRLPAAQLFVALLADRVRTAFGQAGAIVRVHPAGSALPVVAVSVAVTSFLVLSALSVHIVRLPPEAAGGNVAGGPVSGGTPQPLPAPGTGQSGVPSSGASAGGDPAGGDPSSAGPGLVPTPSGDPITSPVTDPSPAPGESGSGGGPGGGTGGGGSTGGGGTSQSPNPPSTPVPGGSTLTGTAATTPPPQDPTGPGAPAGSSSPDPPKSPAPSPTPTTKSGGTGGQVCVDVGTLGICVSL